MKTFGDSPSLHLIHRDSCGSQAPLSPLTLHLCLAERYLAPLLLFYFQPPASVLWPLRQVHGTARFGTANFFALHPKSQWLHPCALLGQLHTASWEQSHPRCPPAMVLEIFFIVPAPRASSMLCKPSCSLFPAVFPEAQGETHGLGQVAWPPAVS